LHIRTNKTLSTGVKMTTAKFKIEGRIDTADGATVTIDRNTMVFSVRPKHSRREYSLPLHKVAEIVHSMVVKSEIPAAS
jgi:hypothetical protein